MCFSSTYICSIRRSAFEHFIENVSVICGDLDILVEDNRTIDLSIFRQHFSCHFAIKLSSWIVFNCYF